MCVCMYVCVCVSYFFFHLCAYLPLCFFLYLCDCVSTADGLVFRQCFQTSPLFRKTVRLLSPVVKCRRNIPPCTTPVRIFGYVQNVSEISEKRLKIDERSNRQTLCFEYVGCPLVSIPT